MRPLTALALNCTLKSSGESSTELLLQQVLDELEGHQVHGEIIRIAALDIKAGVTSDEGDGDDWPSVRTRILAADILVLGSPIWLGQPSSVVKRVVERMDAFLSETKDNGDYVSVGKVAIAAVVGNEDGAHSADQPRLVRAGASRRVATSPQLGPGRVGLADLHRVTTEHRR